MAKHEGPVLTRFGVRLPVEASDNSSLQNVQRDYPDKPPIQWVPGVLPRVSNGRSVKLAIPHLVLRLRLSAAVPPLSVYFFDGIAEGHFTSTKVQGYFILQHSLNAATI